MGQTKTAMIQYTLLYTELARKQVRLADGTIAGSVLKMNDAVRNYRDGAGVPLYEAAARASLSPARSLGLDARKGSLLPGRDADILLLNADCAVQAAWIGGERKL